MSQGNNEIEVFFSIYEEEEVVVNNEPIELGGDEVFFLPENYYDYLLNKICEILELKENWDGYEADSISSEVGETAKNFIYCLNDTQIEKISDIFPNAHGTITIEWINSKGQKLSLEIGKTRYSYFIDYLDNKPKLVDGQDIFSDIKDITAQISQFFG